VKSIYIINAGSICALFGRTVGTNRNFKNPIKNYCLNPINFYILNKTKIFGK
jgi:hypothetical protein